MSKKAMTLALEALLNWKAAYPDEFDLFDEQAITALRGALAEPQEKYIYGTSLLDAMTGKQPAPPPECQTDAEKTAFAFGWWKALEHVRQQPAQQEPFGHVTVRRLSQRFENHHDQYHFYPAGQSPYLDNVDECHAVYTSPQPSKPWVGLTDEEVKHQWEIWRASIPRYVGFATGIEAKLREKNNG